MKKGVTLRRLVGGLSAAGPRRICTARRVAFAIAPVCAFATHRQYTQCAAARADLETSIVAIDALLLQRLMRAEELKQMTCWRRWYAILRLRCRLALRAARLALLTAPVVATGSLLAGVRLVTRQPFPELEDAWWALALRMVSAAGPTYIKLCQWAATRNDLFPVAMTSRFRALQDECTPHAIAHTVAVFEATFGADWRHVIDISSDNVLGSGCIAQVYKGKSVDDGRDVAIKVVHPGVRDVVECDMALLRGAGDFLEGCFPGLRYLALQSSLKAFDGLMSRQLDLSEEARNLERLGALWKDDPTVVIPQPLARFAATPDVLVETFVEGAPIRSFIGGAAARELAERGARVVLQMVLQHNFVHGDLHPGNLLVTPDLKICLLDAGICVELDDKAHSNLVEILRAMLEARGRDAARLMLASNAARATASERDADQEDRFAEGIAQMVEGARHQLLFDSLGNYYRDICSLAVLNHVALDASFVSIALAVKIIEGLVNDLNPGFALLELAMPMFIKAQVQREGVRKLSNLSVYARGLVSDIRSNDGADDFFDVAGC
ncbi:kinase-like domain-containing protein [Pelagophyceae sp. CCMP2097]|nr:kinase-like domain-containing protein [Pelagophyceae sp. CCMP2097]|mmetsp:Transcript_15389/g.51849  ORF Transcript_15389/g.51849 Transcript_15389/m.51849 type:complete len:553 (-) Transcript_15389:80-1738(-)